MGESEKDGVSKGEENLFSGYMECITSIDVQSSQLFNCETILKIIFFP